MTREEIHDLNLRINVIHDNIKEMWLGQTGLSLDVTAIKDSLIIIEGHLLTPHHDAVAPRRKGWYWGTTAISASALLVAILGNSCG